MTVYARPVPTNASPVRMITHVINARIMTIGLPKGPINVSIVEMGVLNVPLLTIASIVILVTS